MTHFEKPFSLHTIVVIVVASINPLTMVYPTASSHSVKAALSATAAEAISMFAIQTGPFSKNGIMSKLREKEKKMVDQIYCDIETNEVDLTKHLIGEFLVLPAGKFPFCMTCNTLFKFQVHCPGKDGHRHYYAEENQEGYSVRGWICNNPEVVSTEEDLYVHPWLLRMLHRHCPYAALPQWAVRDGNAVKMT
jgi:hypothetical protein